MMAATWILPVCLLAIGDVRTSIAIDEDVDLIELNHFYDELGRHVYDQLIFYEWAPDLREYHVRAWGLIEPKDGELSFPRPSLHDDRYRVTWFDKEHRVVRKIKSDHFRETWTQTDPERLNKQKLDERFRLSLAQRPSRQNLSAEPNLRR